MHEFFNFFGQEVSYCRDMHEDVVETVCKLKDSDKPQQKSYCNKKNTVTCFQKKFHRLFESLLDNIEHGL